MKNYRKSSSSNHSTALVKQYYFLSLSGRGNLNMWNTTKGFFSSIVEIKLFFRKKLEDAIDLNQLYKSQD